METGELFCYSLGSVVDPSTSSVIKYQYKYIPVPVPSTTRLPTNDYVPTRTLRSSNTNLLTAAPPLASPAMGHRGMCPPPVDFQLVNFWGSLSSQSLDDSCGFLCSGAFCGHLDTVSLLTRAYTCIPLSQAFTVRRSLHGICYSNSVRPSVCLSVCLSHSWTVSTWFDLRSRFFHRRVAPSF